jgi:hypothetical protein
MASQQSHRRWLRISALLALLLSLVAPNVSAPTGAQTATGHAQVIAQGTAQLPVAPVSWWLGWAEAPASTGISSTRNFGFVVGDGGTTAVVSDGALGPQLVWLDPGEALFVENGAGQERFAASQAASYYWLDLLPVTAAADPLTQPIGATFQPEAGVQELSLVRDTLAPGESGFIEASANPVLILATSGVLAIAPANSEPFLLEAGQSTTIDAVAEIADAGASPATYVAAIITTRAEAPPAPVASVADLGVWVLRCPPGVVAQPDMTNRGCVLVDPLTSGLEVQITGPALSGALTLGNSGFGDAGARLWTNVPFGAYTLTASIPPGAVGYAVRPVGENLAVNLLPDGTGYTFTIESSLFEPGTYQRVNLDVYLLYP